MNVFVCVGRRHQKWFKIVQQDSRIWTEYFGETLLHPQRMVAEFRKSQFSFGSKPWVLLNSFKSFLIQNVVLINNSRITGPTKILMPVLNFSDNLLHDSHIIFQKKVLITQVFWNKGLKKEKKRKELGHLFFCLNYFMTKQVVWAFREFFLLQFDTKFQITQDWHHFVIVDVVLDFASLTYHAPGWKCRVWHARSRERPLRISATQCLQCVWPYTAVWATLTITCIEDKW